jgi:hypothetical protein
MKLPLERLDIQPMASGNESLALTGRVGWESFPRYAEALVQLMGGTVLERADGPVERVWTVRIDGEVFWLAYDDFPIGVSLEPRGVAASALIPQICRTLVDCRLDAG